MARLLRFRPVFRGDLQGWSFEMDRSMPFELPDAKPHEVRPFLFTPYLMGPLKWPIFCWAEIFVLYKNPMCGLGALYFGSNAIA